MDDSEKEIKAKKRKQEHKKCLWCIIIVLSLLVFLACYAKAEDYFISNASTITLLTLGGKDLAKPMVLKVKPVVGHCKEYYDLHSIYTPCVKAKNPSPLPSPYWCYNDMLSVTLLKEPGKIRIETFFVYVIGITFTVCKYEINDLDLWTKLMDEADAPVVRDHGKEASYKYKKQ